MIASVNGSAIFGCSRIMFCVNEYVYHYLIHKFLCCNFVQLSMRHFINDERLQLVCWPNLSRGLVSRLFLVRTCRRNFTRLRSGVVFYEVSQLRPQLIGEIFLSERILPGHVCSFLQILSALDISASLNPRSELLKLCCSRFDVLKLFLCIFWSFTLS